MPCFEALFCLTPLMHSEDMMDVDLFVRELTPLHFNTRSTNKRHSALKLEEHLRYAQLHLEVVSNFGRYPHRNAALNRESTPQEVEYLKNPKKIDF